MNRAFHRFFLRSLLWLLVAALPLQGFAAAVRTCCVQQADTSVAIAAAPAPHCHAMADMAAGVKMDHPADKAMQHGHDCSNHGACTVAAAAPPPVPMAQPLNLLTARPAPAGTLAFAGHIPAGPERPPRSTRSA